jgi:alpha-1,3-mannosyltransferase
MEKALEKLLDFRLLLILEALGGILIINYRSYTELDWESYMSQSKGFLEGDYNYLNLKGPSGPLVYPAGFLYIFSIFFYICDYGTSIRVNFM